MNLPDLSRAEIQTFCFTDCTRPADGMLHAEIFGATIDLPVCSQCAADMTTERLLEYYTKG